MSGFQFKPRLIHQIRESRKTQTRRPMKPYRPEHDRDRRTESPTVTVDGRTYHVPRACDRSYAVQPGRGKPSDGLRITLTTVRHEPIGEITFADARAEGFKTTDDFKVAWVRIHDGGWVRKQETTKLADGTALSHPLEDTDMVERFNARHASTLVWVYEFEVDTSHRVRLLGDRNARADYVENPVRALDDAGEAIEEERQQRYADEGTQATVARIGEKERARDLLKLEDRLAVVRSEAKEKGVDIGPQERAILQRIRGIEKTVRKAA